MKNLTENNKVFSSDQVMSLLENMNEGIQLICEQHGGIISRLDGLETRFDRLETRFDGLETRFDGLQDDVTEIKHKLDQKVDLEDFQRLEKRFLKLEKLVLSKQ